MSLMDAVISYWYRQGTITLLAGRSRTKPSPLAVVSYATYQNFTIQLDKNNFDLAPTIARMQAPLALIFPSMP